MSVTLLLVVLNQAMNNKENSAPAKVVKLWSSLCELAPLEGFIDADQYVIDNLFAWISETGVSPNCILVRFFKFLVLNSN